MSAEGLQTFLEARGVLKPANKKFADQKDQETYTLVNQSSYMNVAKHESLESQNSRFNEIMALHTEQREIIEYEPAEIDYKKELIDACQLVMDPFNTEIKDGEIDYEMNPSDPSHPQKKVEITAYSHGWQ